MQFLTHCLVCEKRVKTLLNLNEQPLANHYHESDNELKTYPLEICYCDRCFHVQQRVVVDKEVLFKNYIYTSGTSNTSKLYFQYFAEKALKRAGLTNYRAKVLDIACNDGSQLDAFKKLDCITIGVDPAENLYHLTRDNHNVICDFFNEKCVKSIDDTYGPMDIIVAQNVFAHVENPCYFMELAKSLLSEKGVLFIQTSQKNMILNNEFDTLYHEHISFFNTKSMSYLCNLNGLILNRIDEEDIHGKSYLFEIRRYKTFDTNLVENLQSETKLGLYSIDTYNKYSLRVYKKRNDFFNKIIEYKLQGRRIIGFGSTAKSNTLINFIGLDSSYIEWIIDENILKNYLLTPGSNIVIKGLDSIAFIRDGDVIIIFAWNFYDEILKKIRENCTKKIIVLNCDNLFQITI